MWNSYNDEDGRKLVKAARHSISMFLSRREIPRGEDLLPEPKFQQKSGCFVTLKLNDEEKTLRGCVGFAKPAYKLSRAIPELATTAATQDPRFRPVSFRELGSILVEVSILTPPEIIKVDSPRQLPSEIQVGKDGLILKWSFGSGLLLPQVATDFNWDAEEFLSNLSMKAGAPPDQWLVPGSVVLKFQSTVFCELEPNGEVSLLI